MGRRLIDRKDIIEDILNNIAPKYFTDNINKNRVGTFGYITEVQAKSFEDTVILNRQRSQDFITELSDNESQLKQLAKIRGGIPVDEATPAKTSIILIIKHSDILERGEKINNEYKFIIDKRSTILNNGINYSIENDILIRAMDVNNKIVYSANYIGGQSDIYTYIQTFNITTDDGSPAVGLLLDSYQYRYNVIEKIVTDELEFTYDGIEFEYNDKLCGFDVYYKPSTSSTYTRLEKTYYLSDMKDSNSILYNDDVKGVIYIVNNPLIGIKENYKILVEIKETLGADGIRSIGDNITTFELYKDDAYNYAGVNISCDILTDPVDGRDADTLEQIRTKLINAKFERKNITTDHDIKSYINDKKANIQIVKKRNDIVDRIYNVYTLLNVDSKVAPTRTVDLKIYDDQFDVIHNISGRKILKSNNTFILDNNVAIKQNISDVDIPSYEANKETLCLNMPFMMAMSNELLISYFFNTIKKSHVLKSKYINDKFPYQLISRELIIERNSLDSVNYDTYKVKINAMLNTSNDLDIVNELGAIVDPNRIKLFALFRNETDAVGYVPLVMSEYNRATRMFTFIGSFKTSDYITETGKLQITDGMKLAGTTDTFDGVIDYKNILIDIACFYNEIPESTTNELYTKIPGMTSYTLCNVFDNKDDGCNLLIELNKIMRSTVTAAEETVNGVTKIVYNIKEIPFIKYSYSKNNILDIYAEIDTLSKVYTSLIKKISDFTINLKFISTYGKSKYITIGDNTDLANLNPVIKFRIYGKNITADEIKAFILNQFMNSYIDDTYLFISNINTLVEKTYNIKSIEYIGIDSYNSSYQKITYTKPDLSNKNELLAYVPEYLNIENIIIEIIEL